MRRISSSLVRSLPSVPYASSSSWASRNQGNIHLYVRSLSATHSPEPVQEVVVQNAGIHRVQFAISEEVLGRHEGASPASATAEMQ